MINQTTPHVTATPEPGVVVSAARSAVALWDALRPRQWIKNLVVLAAPLAAGELLRPAVALPALIAVAAFCLASSAGYLVNDVMDAPADRLHPTKMLRPVASGRLSPPLAIAGAVALSVASLLIALTTGQPRLLFVLAVYLAATFSYSLGAKRVLVIDLAIVASGFVLRAIAGGVATGISLSDWFLLVASFGSLFMVAGKRYSELRATQERIPDDVPPADGYSLSYLRFVWGMSAGAALFAYAVWAFDPDTSHANMVWAQISTAPFVLALLRYAVDVDHGRAGTPEEIVLRDRVLQVLGLIWLASFSLAAGIF
jgi:decaprenyl-phosphate phosphoribosyltransferase